MKKFVTLLTLAICIFFSSSAQENLKYQNKIYKTWISLNTKTWTSIDNKESMLRGVLYEIKDSSVLISNSLLRQDYLKGNFKVSYIDFKNIDHLHVRSKNSLAIGTFIGFVLGVVGAYGIAQGIAREDEIAGAMVIVGTPFIFLGTAIGASAGSLRIHIPINGNYENFKRNENRLERYSYLKEYSSGTNIYEKAYEHKWFFGLLMGPSFPSGDFKGNFTSNTKDNVVKTGGTGNFILGYSYKESFGISASFFNSSYNIKNSTTDKWWNLVSFLAGPMFTVPLRNSFFIDLKPMIGYTDASLIDGESTVRYGNGFGLYASTSLRYNFSKRWCALAETGYLFSRQNFWDSVNKMQTINFCFGIGYRFL